LYLKEIIQLLEAEILIDNVNIEKDVPSIYASDLISEVLASCSRGALWVTGLLDIQVISTAELFDLVAVIFVGNRRPGKDIIKAANEESIPIFLSKLCMYEACGRLFMERLPSAKR